MFCKLYPSFGTGIIAIVIGCVDSLSLKEIKDDCKNCHATPNYPKDAKALK